VDPHERHYNINKLNVIFAISSIVLLLSLLWMVKEDYDREWKGYQKEFRVLEVEKTRVKYDAASNKLEGEAEYQDLKKQLKEAQEKFAAQCPNFDQLNEEIAKRKAADDLVQQEYKFSKAEYDAAKYRYEESKAHHAGNGHKPEENFLNLKQKTSELNLQAEDSSQKFDEKQAMLDDCNRQVDNLQRQERQLAKQKDLLERKLSKIDPNAMSFANRMAELVRDLPIIDLANPNYKIEQVVLKDLRDDVNFMTVPKVERCITCHLGISNPDYIDAVQPFKTHPNLNLFVDKNSPHPLEEFGCTTCHGGRPRGTDFIAAIHIPSSNEQKEKWEEKYNWHKIELWEDPMLPMPYVEAGCFKCHSGQAVIKGAEKLNLGLHLIEKAGCYGCHTIEKYEGWPKAGPNLSKLAAKVNKDWAYKWIQNPESFRHSTWMPTFFNQSNSNDPASVARGQQEIHAIVHYLFSHSSSYEVGEVPFKGNAQKGEELVASLGCFACHQKQPAPSDEPTTRDILRRQHGPNLIGLGSKTSPQWIYSWIKDPNRYHSDTRMPNLRLTDKEASDVTAYLSSDKMADFDSQTVPPVDTNVLNEIVLRFLRKNETDRTARQSLTRMGLDQKLDFAGEKLIAQHGCFGCHDITGFDSTKPIGTDLTEEGSKSIHKLDFGFVHIDHTKQVWFDQKLKDPRIFDNGKVKAPDEKLKMPNFHFSQKETDAIVTALLGFVEDNTVEHKKVSRTPENLYIEEGQKIIRQFNCQGCHIIEGEGGAIRPTVQDWLVKYDNRSQKEAEAVVPSFSPPDLIGEGQKVQAQWLFNFLHQPTTIRPWLKARMPTYQFNGVHLNALVKYFNALDKQDFPFGDQIDVSLTEEEYKDAEKLFSNDYFACAQCHIVGDKLPGGSPDSWAPDFALAQTRLKPGWIIKWLMDPQELLPGTKMPTYFDPSNFDASGPDDLFDGDENIQIHMLRNYLMTITDTPAEIKTLAPQANAVEESQ